MFDFEMGIRFFVCQFVFRMDCLFSLETSTFGLLFWDEPMFLFSFLLG